MWKPIKHLIIMTMTLLAAAASGAAPSSHTIRPISAGLHGAAGGYVEVEGTRYFYRQQGSGRTLVLLHGGLGSMDMFQPLLAALSTNRKVLTVDLRGHGRTALNGRPIDPEEMAGALTRIMDALVVEQADVAGYSLGGLVGLQLAFREPHRVRKLAVISAPYSDHGYYDQIRQSQVQLSRGMAEAMKDTPMYKSYVRVAPVPSDFPLLLDAMGEWIRKPYDWSAQVGQLTMPVLLVYGDADMISLDHAVSFYKLLGGGLKDAGWERESMSQNRLAILPGRTHYDIFVASELARTLSSFFEGSDPDRRWSGVADDGTLSPPERGHQLRSGAK